MLSKLNRLSSKKIGEALNKMGVHKVQKSIEGQITWVYPVYEKTAQEIEQQYMPNVLADQTQIFS